MGSEYEGGCSASCLVTAPLLCLKIPIVKMISDF